MTNNDKWLYLMSSNATKEYILDILEVLAMPSGCVQHFRYQLRWLDKELRSKLPVEGQGQTSELKNRSVVICYLYQVKTYSGWEWVAVYPIRLGILIDAYRTGDKDEDVSHFYFKVNNYVSYNGQDFTKTFKECEKWGKFYAFLDTILNDTHIANGKNSKSAFHTICNSLPFEHLKSPKGNEYFPIYCFVDGLKDKKGEPLVPKYDPLTHKSFYEIAEGGHYSFAFSTSFTPVLPPPQYKIKLVSDKNVFSTPYIYKLIASSRYDEESWAIVSRLLERDIWTSLSFEIQLPDKVDNKESLNIRLIFPIRVKRKILYRVIDVASDICLVIGTGAIALKAAVPQITWWRWAAIFGYLAFAICKLLIKFWRG
jgi:hypothetical protein